MRITRRILLLVLGVQLLIAGLAMGQSRREINFPDILGYKTLKCDLHMHTVFSDGLVWPTMRVDEAWREGLDVISITDHIEYQPHKKDIPTNHNRPYDIVRGRAREKNILLIRGAEITRNTPPGHFNAIFLQDVNPLDTKELTDAMKAADQQGAFIFWNHPGWKPEHKGWFEVHTKLYDNGYMNGIEVCNGVSYYPEAHQWAIEKNLTMMGNSDIHQPVITDERTAEDHRTLTLVFAQEKSLASIKEALENRRTIVWYKNQLIGRRQFLEALVKSALQVSKPHLRQGDYVWFEVTNNCEVDLKIRKVEGDGPATAVLPANTTTIIKTKVDKQKTEMECSYVITNCLIAPGKGLPVSGTIPLE